MALVDLEKAFDHVPRKVIWWTPRKLGVEEWIVGLIQEMYANAGSRVHVGEGFSKEFEVKVGSTRDPYSVPCSSSLCLRPWHVSFELVFLGRTYMQMILSSLLTPSKKNFRIMRRLLIWKEAMEKKGLRVNAGKTKVMICGTGLDLLQSSEEYPCAVCRTGVGNNSILLQWLQTLGV